MKIGRLTMENGAVLAPLCGLSTRPFRTICRRLGAAAVYTETLSSDALFHLNRKTIDMARFHEEERPIGVQIFGREAERVALAAQVVEDMVCPDLIDLNFGCPAPKFVKNGRGAALLKEPDRIAKIVRAVSRAVKIPVTVKIRAGWDDSAIVVAEVAGIVEAEGANALTVHGRTRAQGYGGTANWEWVAEAVRRVRIPVIGNGDITDAETAVCRMRESGCAGIMVGRAAIGNPWIFRSIAERFRNGKASSPPGPAEKLRVSLDHLALLVEDRGEQVGVHEFRRHMANYVKGYPGSSAFRGRANRIESRTELEESLTRFFDALDCGESNGS